MWGEGKVGKFAVILHAWSAAEAVRKVAGRLKGSVIFDFVDSDYAWGVFRPYPETAFFKTPLRLTAWEGLPGWFTVVVECVDEIDCEVAATLLRE